MPAGCVRVLAFESTAHNEEIRPWAPAWPGRTRRVAFGLELAALAVLGRGGWQLGGSTAVRLLLAVGLPLRRRRAVGPVRRPARGPPVGGRAASPSRRWSSGRRPCSWPGPPPAALGRRLRSPWWSRTWRSPPSSRRSGRRSPDRHAGPDAAEAIMASRLRHGRLPAGRTAHPGGAGPALRARPAGHPAGPRVQGAHPRGDARRGAAAGRAAGAAVRRGRDRRAAGGCCSCCRAWTPAARAASSSTSSAPSSPQGVRYHRASSGRRRRSCGTPSSGGSAGRCRSPGLIGVFDRSHYEDVLDRPGPRAGHPARSSSGGTGEIVRFEKPARRRRRHARQVLPAHLAVGAAGAAARPARRLGQALEVQPRRHRRARAVAGLPATPTRPRWSAPTPTPRPGTSSPPTASGTATGRSAGCCWRR